MRIPYYHFWRTSRLCFNWLTTITKQFLIPTVGLPLHIPTITQTKTIFETVPLPELIKSTIIHTKYLHEKLIIYNIQEWDWPDDPCNQPDRTLKNLTNLQLKLLLQPTLKSTIQYHYKKTTHYNIQEYHWEEDFCKPPHNIHLKHLLHPTSTPITSPPILSVPNLLHLTQLSLLQHTIITYQNTSTAFLLPTPPILPLNIHQYPQIGFPSYPIQTTQTSTIQFPQLYINILSKTTPTFVTKPIALSTTIISFQSIPIHPNHLSKPSLTLQLPINTHHYSTITITTYSHPLKYLTNTLVTQLNFQPAIETFQIPVSNQSIAPLLEPIQSNPIQTLQLLIRTLPTLPLQIISKPTHILTKSLPIPIQCPSFTYTTLFELQLPTFQNILLEPVLMLSTNLSNYHLNALDYPTFPINTLQFVLKSFSIAHLLDSYTNHRPTHTFAPPNQLNIDLFMTRDLAIYICIQVYTLPVITFNTQQILSKLLQSIPVLIQHLLHYPTMAFEIPYQILLNISNYQIHAYEPSQINPRPITTCDVAIYICN